MESLMAQANQIPITPSGPMTKRQTKQKPDPIFALIEEHKKATAENIAANKAVSTMRLDDPAERAADQRCLTTWKTLRAMQLKLLKATPTTMKGCIALMRHVSTPQAEEAFGGGFDYTPLGDCSASYGNNDEDGDRLVKIAHAFLPRIADRIERLSAT
jgi:hypothetical protein